MKRIQISFFPNWFSLVISFNGAKYDIRVCRGPLISILLELEDIKYVIKRGGAYACIATESLRFLDVVSYLAAGSSYDGFLKAYNASEAKSYFPYEHFTSLELLDSTEFPPYNAFYSTLKQKNTLEPRKNDLLLQEEITLIGRTPTPKWPLTDTEILQISNFRYQTLMDKFNNNGWTMRDYLIDYNNG